MIARNHVLQVELIEKTLLPTNCRAHHRRNPLTNSTNQGNHANPIRANDFFDRLGYEAKSACQQEASDSHSEADVLVPMSAFAPIMSRPASAEEVVSRSRNRRD